MKDPEDIAKFRRELLGDGRAPRDEKVQCDLIAPPAPTKVYVDAGTQMTDLLPSPSPLPSDLNLPSSVKDITLEAADTSLRSSDEDAGSIAPSELSVWERIEKKLEPTPGPTIWELVEQKLGLSLA